MKKKQKMFHILRLHVQVPPSSKPHFHVAPSRHFHSFASSFHIPSKSSLPQLDKDLQFLTRAAPAKSQKVYRLGNRQLGAPPCSCVRAHSKHDRFVGSVRPLNTHALVRNALTNRRVPSRRWYQSTQSR